MNQWETFIVYACLTNILFSFVHMSCQWQKKRKPYPPKKCCKKTKSNVQYTIVATEFAFIRHISQLALRKKTKERKKKKYKHIEQNKTKVENINLLFTVDAFLFLLCHYIKMTNFFVTEFKFDGRKTVLIWHSFKCKYCLCVIHRLLKKNKVEFEFQSIGKILFKKWSVPLKGIENSMAARKRRQKNWSDSF